MSAILHDILEDTEVSSREIESSYSKEISDIVQSLTFDGGSGDFGEKIKEAEKSFWQSAAIGADALCVRAADLIDNSYYYKKSSNRELNDYLKQKYLLFIKISQSKLENTAVWDLLNEAFETNVKTL